LRRFYDALHHAENERAALASPCRALRPGGVVVTMEPGEGHAKSPGAVEARRLYGVNEKDMPPAYLLELGRAVGFRRGRVYLRPISPELAFDTEAQPAPAVKVDPPLVKDRVRRFVTEMRGALRTLIAPPAPPVPEWPPLHLRLPNFVVLEK
jgi:hypothetical protein